MVYTTLNELLSDLRYLSTWLPVLFENNLGISLVRYEMMVILSANKELSQTRLQQLLDLDRAAISRHLQILETKGLIVRNRTQTDQRVQVVRLTEAGEKVMTSCHQEHEQLITSLLAGVTQQQLEKTASVLTRLRKQTEQLLDKASDMTKGG